MHPTESRFQNRNPHPLVSAGATVVREDSDGEHLDHIVMLDPEGNEFCLADGHVGLGQRRRDLSIVDPDARAANWC